MVASVIARDARRSRTVLAVAAGGAGLAIWIAQFAGGMSGFGVLAPIAAVVAAFACVQAARSSARTSDSWLWLAAGCLLWSSLSLLNGVIVATGDGSSSATVLQIASLAFALVGGVGIARVTLAGRLTPIHADEWFDGLLTALATIVISVEFILFPLLDRVDKTAGDDRYLLDIAFQVAAIGIVLLLTVALAIGRAVIRYDALLLLLAGVLTPAVTVAYSGGLATALANDHLGILALGWLFGFTLMILATWRVRGKAGSAYLAGTSIAGARFRRIGGVACVCLLTVTAVGIQALIRSRVDWIIVSLGVGIRLLIGARLIHAGTIAERLRQRTRERDRLETVLSLSPEIVGTLDVVRLLPALASTAARTIGRSCAEITLIGPSGNIANRVTYGLNDDEIRLLDQTVTTLPSYLATPPLTPSVHILDELNLPSSTAELFRAVDKHEVLIAPLRAQGQALGVLELWTPGTVLPFTDDDIKVVTAIVREGGFAIHNAQLLATTLASAEERSMLLRVTQAATSSLDLGTVLDEIAQASLGIASTECCTILLLDEDSDELEIGADQTVPDWPGTEAQGARFPVDRFGSDVQVMRSRQPRRYDQHSPELPDSEREHMQRHGTESILVVPLIAGEICLGTLNLLSRQPGVFDDNATRLGIEIAGQTALAIQHARLLAETRRHAEEQSVLLRVGKAATSSLDITRILEEITHAALDIPGAECCAVLFWDQELNELEMGFESTIADWAGVDPPGTRYSLHDVALQLTIIDLATAVTLNDDDHRLSDRDKADLAGWGIKSLMVVPLFVGDECLGIIQTYSRTRDAFGAAALRLGRDIASQTALAVHNARLLAESRQYADELASRLRVSHAVSSSLQLDEVLEEVARASLGVAGAESCEIELWMPERNATILAAQQAVADWPNEKNNIGMVMPIENWPTTHQILTTGEAMIVHENDPRLSDHERIGLFDLNTRSGLVVPIVVDGQSLGMLSLFSRHPNAFSARALAIGQDLASQAALAIERARLHTAIQERARTDALTGILNRGAIEEELDRELTRTRRNGQTMAVLIIDLNDFKQVNDQHGHLVGDRVLQQTALLLKRSVRGSDQVGRYGGDEFLAVLSNTDEAGAIAAAERILNAGQSARIATDSDGVWLPIHLSIGFAVYPRDGSDHEELIGAADRAMYALKPVLSPDVTDFEAAQRSRSTPVALTAD